MDSLRSELMEGTVFVKKKWRYRKRYAVACTGREPIGVETGSSEGRQAHLLIYSKSHKPEDILERINFSAVLGVSAGPSGITLRLPESFPADFRFRTKRSSENEQWMKACTLLNAFPNYPIPSPPEAPRSLLRPELASLSSEYCELYNAYDVWTVHVLPYSVASTWNIVGLQLVAIGKEDNMFKVINAATGKTQLKMARHEILRCGFWESMVCLEVSVGLRGVLWMDCLQNQVKQIRDKIHNFAFYGMEGRLPPLPHFPSFFSDLPFSPRCYFEASQRSRSNSLSSQSSSDRPETVSDSLEMKLSITPHVKLINHPSFTPRLVSPSTKYLSRVPMDQKQVQKPEPVHRDKKRRSILLESSNPADSSIPCGYIEPISTKSCGNTTRKVYQPKSCVEDYIEMHSTS